MRRPAVLPVPLDRAGRDRPAAGVRLPVAVRGGRLGDHCNLNVTASRRARVHLCLQRLEGLLLRGGGLLVILGLLGLHLLLIERLLRLQGLLLRLLLLLLKDLLVRGDLRGALRRRGLLLGLVGRLNAPLLCIALSQGHTLLLLLLLLFVALLLGLQKVLFLHLHSAARGASALSNKTFTENKIPDTNVSECARKNHPTLWKQGAIDS